MQTIKGNSLAQDIQVALTSGASPVDLAGKTVKAFWVDLTTDAKTEVSCSAVGAASGGVVKFALTPEMVPAAGGYFALFWVVTITANGKEQVVPNAGAEEFFVEPRADYV